MILFVSNIFDERLQICDEYVIFFTEDKIILLALLMNDGILKELNTNVCFLLQPLMIFLFMVGITVKLVHGLSGDDRDGLAPL
jgi:hypothetical protein